PHRIARYRPTAYQKAVVMKYLDTLLAQGDSLLQENTPASINQASRLYTRAAEILGPRPKNNPPLSKPAVETFNELESNLDEFSNPLVQLENLIPVLHGNEITDGDTAPLPLLSFCIPPNDKLRRYRDRVAEQLYKIRHGRNNAKG